MSDKETSFPNLRANTLLCNIYKTSWLALLFVAFAPFQSVSGQSTSLSDAITSAFEQHWIVGIGENHGHAELHEVLNTLLTEPAIQATVDDIVVEFGNAFYQDLIDRYTIGELVPFDSVKLAWRNTVVSPNTVWDAPVYEQFFVSVRSINQNRKDGRQYRIVLADSPVNWGEVHSLNDLRPYFDRSDNMLSVIRKEVLRKGRKALLIAGGAHLTRVNIIRKSKQGVPRAEVSLATRLELFHPGVLYIIRSIAKERCLDHSTMGQVPRGNVVVSTSPIIASKPANCLSTMRNRDGSPFNAYREATIADLVDAVIYWGPESINHFPKADKSTYQDTTYWNALNRRSMLLRKKPMDTELRE